VNPMVFLVLSALFAIGHAAGEALLFQVLKASIVVWKLTVKIADRIAKLSGNRLSAVHGKTNIADS
jgi:hypothetical protein